MGRRLERPLKPRGSAFSLNTTAVDLALYVNALSFAFAAFTIWGLREIPKGAAAKHAAETGILKSLHEGKGAAADIVLDLHAQHGEASDPGDSAECAEDYDDKDGEDQVRDCRQCD